MGRGRGRRRGWEEGCGCEYVEVGFLVEWVEWNGVDGKRLIVVWVVGSSWLMMLLIRGVYFLSEIGKG